ncbi:hypothetical protein E2562_013616 [Oryza meyeriana var. granulata]|uniref:Uncharacterized protein n=1 Tax=Oryza meyeriana var. granulata TaxID=110450 RepID=A0A6G1C6V4_9ORYZ|nr:hypothetical protein E2562_013616 [Oryza meyeriana var. granulata]
MGSAMDFSMYRDTAKATYLMVFTLPGAAATTTSALPVLVASSAANATTVIATTLVSTGAATRTPPSVPAAVCVEVLSSPSTSVAEGLVGLVALLPTPWQPVAVMAQVPSEEEEPHVSEELHADMEPQEEV